MRGESVKQIAQRLRRMAFSIHTESVKSPASKLMDELLSDKTTYADPPLTTDHVDQATLDEIFACRTILTARNLEVDVAHIWAVVDLALNGHSLKGGLASGPFLDTDTEALLSWAGDVGGAVNDWAIAMQVKPKPDEATSQAILKDLVTEHVTKSDLLGDMDGVVLARLWSGDSDRVVLSTAFAAYYDKDALSQADAKKLAVPNSARRFHHFFKVAVPEFTTTAPIWIRWRSPSTRPRSSRS